MAIDEGCGRLLHRVTRDLRAPMALLVAEFPVRSVFAHHGFEDQRAVQRLTVVDPSLTRTDGDRLASHDDGVRAWAATMVRHEGNDVGTLFVADRRRRWFDDEELRHLGLISSAAGPLIAAMGSVSTDAQLI